MSGPIKNLQHEVSSEAECSKKIQSNIKDCFASSSQWDHDDVRAKELHYAIAEMIVIDNQPLSIVGNIGFSKLIKKLKPKYTIPSRKHITDVVIPDIYNRTKNVLKVQITEAVVISCTTDMWTNNNNMQSFISLTVHWITNDFLQKHSVLQMKHFSGQHTGDNIRKAISGILTYWDIPIEKIHVILRDNGANIVKGLNESTYTPIPCFIHTLQLVINDAINIQENIVQMITASRRIVTHFHHSENAQEKLKKHQHELGLPVHELTQDVRTRWNSTYYMLVRLVEQKRAVTLYISENEVKFENLSVIQWQLLEDCLMLLKPFEEVTKMASSSIAIISEVIPNIKALIKYLTKQEARSGNVIQMQICLMQGLRTRFAEIEKNAYYFLATLLDPRYRLQFFSPENISEIRQTFFFETLRRDLSDSTDDETNDNICTKNKQQLCSNAVDEAHCTFWDCYREIASSNKYTKYSDRTRKNDIALELDSYLCGEVLGKEENPLVWWKKCSLKYPKMSQLVKIYLSAPSSTVCSERLFSQASSIYEERRNRLLPDKVEQLVFLHNNLPLINYEY